MAFFRWRRRRGGRGFRHRYIRSYKRRRPAARQVVTPAKRTRPIPSKGKRDRTRSRNPKKPRSAKGIRRILDSAEDFAYKHHKEIKNYEHLAEIVGAALESFA